MQKYKKLRGEAKTKPLFKPPSLPPSILEGGTKAPLQKWRGVGERYKKLQQKIESVQKFGQNTIIF